MSENHAMLYADNLAKKIPLLLSILPIIKLLLMIFARFLNPKVTIDKHWFYFDVESFETALQKLRNSNVLDIHGIC